MRCSLQELGYAVLPSLISPKDCKALAALYAQEHGWRSRVVMERYGFGRGEYQYFAYPLPVLVNGLRQQLYPFLAVIANDWAQQLKTSTVYPQKISDFLARCHEAGQIRPTPLLLQYGPGDYNCLHQDLYGEHIFPLQVAVLLSVPDKDFFGGEFVLTHSMARRQSQVDVVPLRQGDGVVFAVHARPILGKQGVMRKALVRHGVSRVRAGQRHTLGLIFHDAC